MAYVTKTLIRQGHVPTCERRNRETITLSRGVS